MWNQHYDRGLGCLGIPFVDVFKIRFGKSVGIICLLFISNAGLDGRKLSKSICHFHGQKIDEKDFAEYCKSRNKATQRRLIDSLLHIVFRLNTHAYIRDVGWTFVHGLDSVEGKGNSQTLPLSFIFRHASIDAVSLSSKAAGAATYSGYLS